MMNELKETYQKLIDENIESKSIEEVLEILTNTFPDEVCFSTSFSFEDQVITDYVKNSGIKVFTLDTGRLFEDTYNTWNLTKSKYKLAIKAYYPNPEELIGKQVCFITNLEPRKLRGILSEGMILSAENADGSLSLIEPSKEVKPGSQIG